MCSTLKEFKMPRAGTGTTSKKALSIVVDDDLLELMRILMDDNAEAALAFLKQHFKGKARDLLEDG
jgi:hypothetical protein